MALANDNVYLYGLELIYRYRVRWIEAAAASPVSAAGALALVALKRVKTQTLVV